MTIRETMAQAAGRAVRHLNDSVRIVREFLLSQMDDSGGFRGRDGNPDLYYTVFGLEGLVALGGDFDRRRTGRYLEPFGEGGELDFVHLTCLARCLRIVHGEGIRPDLRGAILARLAEFRSGDGGFALAPGASTGTAYAGFLGLSTYQDLEAELPEPMGLVHSLHSLRLADGSCGNEVGASGGAVPATAAAVTALHVLGQPVDSRTIEWLLQRHRAVGGFVAMALSPVPDLLSTATALHALDLVGADLSGIRPMCLEFVDSLWEIEGGFTGNWLDETVDCEYTYYGLLALGHL